MSSRGGATDETSSFVASSHNEVSQASSGDHAASDASTPQRSTWAKKRRAPEDGYLRPRSRVKRLKPLYNSQYRMLFNDSVRDFTPLNISKEFPSFGPSQIGASLWTVEEKAKFFKALNRYGRHHVLKIAAIVQTKSSPEICLFLQLLRQTAARNELHATRRKKLFDVSTAEAAQEIGTGCETALEEAADSLSSLQYREEEKLEREKYPNNWLLTSTTARWLKRSVDSGEASQQELEKEIPATSLLNLKMCLTLSKDFFMNSSDPERNWRKFAERRRPPSIMHTAFSDFYVLVIHFMKNILDSTLQFAHSRIRAETTNSYVPSQAIKQSDVLAAVESLGVDASPYMVWTKVARKCDLTVFENVRYKKVSGKHYNYDEVEKYLSTYDNRRGRYQPRTGIQSRDPSPPNQSKTEAVTDLSSGSGPSEEGTSDASSSNSSNEETNASDLDSEMEELPSSQDEQQSRQETHEARQDGYMEILDQKASQAEENRLWGILGRQDIASEITKNEEISRKKPMPPQKVKEDIVDWTDWVDYASEWEAFKTPVRRGELVVE